VTNKDAQFLELRKFQITDVARLFRVPPHMIGDLDRATFSNIEQQSLEFVMHTMTPWAERWEASIESELLLEGDDIALLGEVEYLSKIGVITYNVMSNLSARILGVRCKE
jgi:HK97 family phage portal protein